MMNMIQRVSVCASQRLTKALYFYMYVFSM